MKNIVYIAKSIDGYIAGKNGELDWLDSTPNPENNDMGFRDLMNEIDALLMGKNTFETVCRFAQGWPYSKPVFVLSNSLEKVPSLLEDKAFIVKGSLQNVLNEIRAKDHNNLYIDGGKVVQSFLAEDLIDELRITTIPIVLGDGIPLFNAIPKTLKFDHIKTEVFLDQIVQTHYARKRK